MRWKADMGFNGWNSVDGTIGENRNKEGWPVEDRVWTLGCIPSTFDHRGPICSIYHGPLSAGKCAVSNATNLWIQSKTCNPQDPAPTEVSSSGTVFFGPRSYGPCANVEAEISNMSVPTSCINSGGRINTACQDPAWIILYPLSVWRSSQVTGSLIAGFSCALLIKAGRVGTGLNLLQLGSGPSL